MGFISHRKICDPSLKISELTAEIERLNKPDSGGESSLKGRSERTYCERAPLSMGCYLEEYGARVGTWAARVS